MTSLMNGLKSNSLWVQFRLKFVAKEVIHLLLRDNPYVAGTIVDVNGGMPVY